MFNFLPRRHGGHREARRFCFSSLVFSDSSLCLCGKKYLVSSTIANIKQRLLTKTLGKLREVKTCRCYGCAM